MIVPKYLVCLILIEVDDLNDNKTFTLFVPTVYKFSDKLSLQYDCALVCLYVCECGRGGFVQRRVSI